MTDTEHAAAIRLAAKMLTDAANAAVKDGLLVRLDMVNPGPMAMGATNISCVVNVRRAEDF